MKKMKKVKIFLLFAALQGYILTKDDPTKADGPDMQTPNNAMFIHSQAIYPDDNPNMYYFQPADGSLNNGTYNKISKKAETDLHSYTNVIIVNGTPDLPTMDKEGNYTDKNGKKLENVGIFNQYGENEGEPLLVYLFGIRVKTKKEPTALQPLQNNAQPLIDYNSFSGENYVYGQ